MPPETRLKSVDVMFSRVDRHCFYANMSYRACHGDMISPEFGVNEAGVGMNRWRSSEVCEVRGKCMQMN